VPEQYYSLSLKDGGLTLVNAAGHDTTPKRWTEALLQHVLVLNPQILGVCDHMPLKLDGGTTSVSPDQLYMDETGRLIIIEAKNECADLAAIAQLLRYSEQYSIMPIGELERSYMSIVKQGGVDEVTAESLQMVRSWAQVQQVNNNLAKPRNSIKWENWPTPNTSWSDFISKHYIQGAPSRLLLLAPDFSKSCIEMARNLRKWYVPIELIRVDFAADAKGEISMLWHNILNDSKYIENTWRTVRRLWKHKEIREYYGLNAWADHLNDASFGFSVLSAPQARFWIEITDQQTSVYTTVPDGWYTGTARRKKLREALLKEVPAGWKASNGRWIKWEFNSPNAEKEFDKCVRGVASAVASVLAVNAPAC